MGGLTTRGVPPKHNVMEVTLVGPGYGECILLHIGNGSWVIVDSCIGADSRPAALAYLHDMGLDPPEVVHLIVATHWHDDHIRGMGELVEVCGDATFCCASALRTQEFLTMMDAIASRPMSQVGSGMQELYKVRSFLEKRPAKPVFAIANRKIFSRDSCEIWSLSPFDEEVDSFLREIDRLRPQERKTKRRTPTLTPNKTAVVLLIKIDDTAILLGSDLEGRGWLDILAAYEGSNCKASVFKVPHHGSQNAHEDRVWSEMLHSEPIAALTPWKKGGRSLPTKSDVKRILSFTRKAYATAPFDISSSKPARRRNRTVEKTIREASKRISHVAPSPGMIRLRRRFGSQLYWDIETFAPACQLMD
ncbi:MAG: MBL fold metallo-hydrolase [Candidatus Latescibacteria bacterium]|nr:MBL fold metallo-hydrolase [Candidatus Latescibacterota bacterium]